MSFTLLSVAILGVISLFIYGQARKGYRKGAAQALINLSVIIACFFFAAWLASAIAKSLTPEVVSFIRDMKVYEEFQKNAGDVSMVMGFVVQIALALLLYIPVFFALRGTFLLCIKIVVRKYITKSNHNREQHFSENETHFPKLKGAKSLPFMFMFLFCYSCKLLLNSYSIVNCNSVASKISVELALCR